MGGREAFGPNLRRIRVQRGIPLDDIARRTKVSIDLWAGLERNDFARWPTGIFARAYVREYAHAIGVDPESTVDDFCRWFTHGDRRAERIVRGQAEIVGHDLRWSDDLAIPDRRSRAEAEPPPARPPIRGAYPTRVRGLLALADITAVGLMAAPVAAVAPIGFWSAVGIVAVAYHLCALSVLGASPSVAFLDWYVAARRPADSRAGDKVGLRVLRGSER